MKQNTEAGPPADAATTAATPAPSDSASVLATDHFAGVAGSFEFDPASGTRRPVAGPAINQPEENQHG